MDSNMADSATLALPMDLIRPAIEAKVNEAVISALGGSKRLIEELVVQIMNRKVDENGKLSDYSSYNKHPWLSVVVRKIVEEAIQKSVTEYVATKTDEIRAAIDAEMRKSKSPLVQSLITSMADGMAKAVSERYRVSVAFSFKE